MPGNRCRVCRLSPDRIRIVHEQIEQGLPWAEIAREINVSAPAVAAHAKHMMLPHVKHAIDRDKHIHMRGSINHLHRLALWTLDEATQIIEDMDEGHPDRLESLNIVNKMIDRTLGRIHDSAELAIMNEALQNQNDTAEAASRLLDLWSIITNDSSRKDEGTPAPDPAISIPGDDGKQVSDSGGSERDVQNDHTD